jgi:ribose-phosphate pyrophosphokinase
MAGDARQRFLDRGIKCIIGADTYPGSRSDELLSVYSVAPLIARELEHRLGKI